MFGTEIRKDEIQYNEFFTQLIYLNRVSDLPKYLIFKVSLFEKYSMSILLFATSVFLIYLNQNMTNFIFATILVGLALFRFFQLDKIELIIDKNEISFNKEIFRWKDVDSIKKLSKYYARFPDYYIELELNNGQKIEHRIDLYGKNKIDEIYQAVYMYRQLWKKNNNILD